MTSPGPSDVIHIEAAKAFLSLGKIARALGELQQVSARHRKHPAVLVLRCRVYFTIKKWGVAFRFAHILTRLFPDIPFWWLQRSHALFCMGQPKQAWKKLRTVSRKFRGEHSVSYALARYAAAIGKTDEASAFLANAWHNAREAKGMARADRLKLDALNDPDIKDLWPRGL